MCWQGSNIHGTWRLDTAATADGTITLRQRFAVMHCCVLLGTWKET